MKNTFTTILLILIAFGFGFLVNKEGFEVDKVVEEPVVEQKTGEEVESEYFEYKSPFGFRFLYDDGMKLENSAIVLAGGYRVSAVAAVRYVEEQHCSASGLPEHCRPFLENPAVAFGVIESSFENLKKDKLKDVIEFSEPITLAGKTGVQYYSGVEGEGVVTIALPFKADQTLLIQYTFDELFDSAKSNESIYGSAEQKSVVDNILNTFTIE